MPIWMPIINVTLTFLFLKQLFISSPHFQTSSNSTHSTVIIYASLPSPLQTHTVQQRFVPIRQHTL